MDKRIRLTWYKQRGDKRVYEIYDLVSGRLVHRGRSFLAASRVYQRLERQYAQLDAYHAAMRPISAGKDR